MSRHGRLVAAVRRDASRRPRSSDRGMVVLETALAIPVLTMVALALAWVVSIGGAALHLGDTVRSAARELARGQSQQAVLDHARDENPGAQFEVVVDGGRVSVAARQHVAPPVPLLDGLGITVQQQAVVPVEWS